MEPVNENKNVFSRQNSSSLDIEKIFKETELVDNQEVSIRQKFNQLLTTLRSHKENEEQLLECAKLFTNKYENLKIDFDKKYELEENKEPLQLQNKLLKQSNLFKQYSERHEQLRRDMQCLKDNKNLLIFEFEDTDNKQESSLLDEDLSHINKENLLIEIQNKKKEIKYLSEDLVKYKNNIENINKNIKELSETYTSSKSEYANIMHKPVLISREVEKLVLQENELKKDLNAATNEIQTSRNALLSLVAAVNKLNIEQNSFAKTLDKSDSALKTENDKLQTIMRQIELAKCDLEELKLTNTELDMHLSHTQSEKETLHKMLKARTNEKNVKLLSIKKMELQLKSMQDACNILVQLERRSANKLEDVNKKIIEKTDLKLKALTKETQHAEMQIKKLDDLNDNDRRKLGQIIAENERLALEYSAIIHECRDLHRLAALKTTEKEEGIFELLKAEQNLAFATDELKTKQVVIDDHRLQLRDVHIRLEDCSNLYNLIKNERNKSATLTQSILQKIAEIKEKIKILENEVEILKFSHAHKDSQLSKDRMCYMLVNVVRDNLRNDLSKHRQILFDLKSVDTQKTLEVGYCKKKMLLLKKEKSELEKKLGDQLVKRNNRNNNLNERKKEIINVSGTVRQQDNVCSKSNITLTSLEEDIKFGKLKLNEEKRLLNLLKRKLPTKYILSEQLVTLQIELAQGYDYLRELEEKFINVDDEGRIRYLQGRDPTLSELGEKIKKLDSRLINKEKEFLEKNLIFEHVSRLLDDVTQNVNQSKESSLALAKEVNFYQEKMQKKNFKLMAIIAEYSMRKAQSLRLEQILNEKEVELQECQLNVERGDPPSKELALEWARLVREDKGNIRKVNKQATVHKNLYTISDNEEDMSNYISYGQYAAYNH